MAKQGEIQRRHERAARETDWNWGGICFLIVLAALSILSFSGLLALLVAGLVAAAVVFALLWRGSHAGANLVGCLIAGGLRISWLVQRIEVGVRAAQWGDDLQNKGTRPVVAQLVRHMLGDDPDSLFIPDHFEWGLRAPREPLFFVENGARRQLERKLSHIADGTIAVCGPRGVGKTTLLDQSVKKAGFGLIIQAPATYTPHDFLLSLSVQLCEKYLRDGNHDVPEFTRLSPTRKLLRRAKVQAKRLGRWGSFAVPAAALLALGLSASVRSLYAQYATPVADFAGTHTERIRDDVMEIWQGYAVVASVCVTVVGIAWWKARHAAWLPRLLGGMWTSGSRPLGLLLACSSVVSLLFDKQIRQQILHLHRTQPDDLTRTAAYSAGLTLAWWLLRWTRDSDAVLPLGRREISLERAFRPLAAAAGMCLLLYLIKNPQTHSLLADSENPLRLVGMVTGVLVARAGGWRPQPEEPALVTKCRDHLYRLQTIQQSTNGLTTGAAQILSLGSTHTTSISTVLPNYPELVEDFRNLLQRIAMEKAGQGKTVVIAIDEVDRLGTDAQALAFLSEIKAILGVPHVYYLISVAEDVGAAFVRRGLPHRDVTDSSLDDIIHVQPSTIAESRAILAERSQALKDPYVILAHALSGGILRDLLRYGLQIREIQDKTQFHELTDLARHLILEELSESFAGFRTLLSKQQWTHHTSEVLASFRILASYLRDPCLCTEAEVLHALEEFAFYTHSTTPRAATATDQSSSAADQEISSDARQLIDEASAYAYFSLTLLDIFSTARFERRTQMAAATGPDGDPERLAEARQELGISPYSARPLIDSIRKAWSLPLGTTTGSRPPLLITECPRHGTMSME
ncbi:hypothetical protein OHT68_49080 (plasmid) [Streptomyces canus]|uniref:hypothetical protein n=1 Tax=Streptomyces canus TaxID=58343 RepID=UPI002E2B71D7|nr:hypothetical protein [Streptomyces canus]